MKMDFLFVIYYLDLHIDIVFFIHIIKYVYVLSSMKFLTNNNLDLWVIKLSVDLDFI
jgi:hypothetical protein